MEPAHSLRAPRPASLRIWHWLNALAMTGILGTVLLRKTFLSWRTNAQVIENEVRELGGAISADQAANIAKTIRAPMWDWHYVFGFALIGLLAMRIAIAVHSRSQMPVLNAWKAFQRFRELPGSRKAAGAHHVMVQVGYVVFYMMLLLMSISGTVMYFAEPLGVAKETVAAIKGNHELLMWFFVVFVPAHIFGVVVAELRGDRGLVSDMIHGGTPQNQGTKQNPSS